jgi:hypothetical protein
VASPEHSGLETGDAVLIRAAEIVVRAAPDVGRVWPGFWTSAKPFVFTRKDPSTMLLVSAVPPPPEYLAISPTLLSDVLRGHTYLRRGFPVGFGGFHVLYRIGDITVPATGLYSGEMRHDLRLFYHEAFHGFQLQKFIGNPAQRAVFGGGSALGLDPRYVPEFEEAAAVERRILSCILQVGSAQQGELRLDYLAVRQQRMRILPAVEKFERWEERHEGTAELVGIQAAVIAMGENPRRVGELIQQGLAQPNHALQASSTNKWRAYAVGAALGFMLDQLGVAWRERVEKGAALDELLMEATSFDPRGAEERAQRARGHFATGTGPAQCERTQVHR